MRTQKQVIAMIMGQQAVASKEIYEFFRPKERYVSRYAVTNFQIDPEMEQALRMLKLWLKVLGEWDGFYVTDCNNIKQREKE